MSTSDTVRHRQYFPSLTKAERFVKAFDRVVAPKDRKDTARGLLPPVALLAGGHEQEDLAQRIIQGLDWRLHGPGHSKLALHALIRRTRESTPGALAFFGSLVDALQKNAPKDTGRLRLPNYWLMHAVTTADESATHNAAALRNHCYEQHRARSKTAQALWWFGLQEPPTNILGTFWQALAKPIFQVFPQWLYGRRITRRIVRSNKHGWFAHWRHLTHDDPSIDFFEHARDLTPSHPLWAEENVHRALLLALLTDLQRVARPGRISPWRRRRITRSVLFVEVREAADETTARFLKEYCEAASIAGSTSVLAFVVAPEEHRQALGLETATNRDLDDAATALESASSTPGGIEPTEPLSVSVNERHQDPQAPPSPIMRNWIQRKGWRIGPKSELVLEAGALALTLVAAIQFGLPGLPPFDSTCGPERFALPDRECAGLSEDGRDFGPTDKEHNEVFRMIREQNRQVDQLAEQGKKLHRTVVYFGPLASKTNPAENWRDSVLAELRGVALKQRLANKEAGDDQTAVRLKVLLANTGDRFVEAPAVADLIVDRMHRDPTVVGVLGFTQSRTKTQQAIQTLDALRVPMIGIAATADGMRDQSAQYYQVAPINDREAQVATSFVRNALMVKTSEGASTEADFAVIVEDPTDIYSDNLSQDFQYHFGKSKTSVVSYATQDNPHLAPPNDSDPVPNLNVLAQRVCLEIKKHAGTVVFWTGRVSEFAGFLDNFDKVPDCHGRLTVLGGDDLSNSLIQEQRPTQEHPGLTLYHLAHAVPDDEQTERNTVAQTFARMYGNKFGKDAMFSDGHAALAWDGFSVLAEAINDAFRSSKDTKFGRDAVSTSLYKGIGPDGKGIQGATGVLTFRGMGRSSRVPRNKPLYILHDKPNGSEVIVRCGVLTTEMTWMAWEWGDKRALCPTDS